MEHLSHVVDGLFIDDGLFIEDMTIKKTDACPSIISFSPCCCFFRCNNCHDGDDDDVDDENDNDNDDD